VVVVLGILELMFAMGVFVLGVCLWRRIQRVTKVYIDGGNIQNNEVQGLEQRQKGGEGKREEETS
jgi:hypothetical protein